MWGLLCCICKSLELPKLKILSSAKLRLVPSKVREDSTVASSESLKVRTPLAVDPSNYIPLLVT